MLRRIVKKLIRVYQLFISPMLLPRCRFYPSCSDYALQAFEKYGFLKGLYLSCWRILRCNPFNRHYGRDPLE